MGNDPAGCCGSGVGCDHHIERVGDGTKKHLGGIYHDNGTGDSPRVSISGDAHAGTSIAETDSVCPRCGSRCGHCDQVRKEMEREAAKEKADQKFKEAVDLIFEEVGKIMQCNAADFSIQRVPSGSTEEYLLWYKLPTHRGTLHIRATSSGDIL